MSQIAFWMRNMFIVNFQSLGWTFSLSRIKHQVLYIVGLLRPRELVQQTQFEPNKLYIQKTWLFIYIWLKVNTGCLSFAQFCWCISCKVQTIMALSVVPHFIILTSIAEMGDKTTFKNYMDFFLLFHVGKSLQYHVKVMTLLPLLWIIMFCKIEFQSHMKFKDKF